MALTVTSGLSFLDTVGSNSWFENGDSTLDKLVSSTAKASDTEYNRAVKQIQSVDMQKTRSARVDAPQGQNIRFMIKATRKPTKFADKLRSYATYLGMETVSGLVEAPCKFVNSIEAAPIDDATREYLLTEEGKSTRAYAVVQMLYALSADKKAALEADDEELLASHPALLAASPHFNTSGFITDEMRQRIVLARVPDYFPPQKENAKKLPAIPASKFQEFLTKALQDEILIADLCAFIYLNNTLESEEILKPGDSFHLGYPGPNDPKTKQPRTVPKICTCIASGYIVRTTLLSLEAKYDTKTNQFIDKRGIKANTFWKHDDSLYKILLEIPAKVLFNYRVDKRDLTHSLGMITKNERVYLAVLPQRTRAFMAWAKMFSNHLQNLDDIAQLAKRREMSVGFATFGPYTESESNFKREAYASSSKTSTVDKEKLKKAKEHAKTITTVGGSSASSKSAASNEVAAVAEKKEKKSTPEGVYFDWFLMHLEIQMGPILNDVPGTNLTDVNTNVFSTFIHAHFNNSVLQKFGIGFMDIPAAKSIIHPLLFSSNFGIDCEISNWDQGLAKSSKLFDTLVGQKLQPMHLSEWEKLIGELKAAHVGIPQMSAENIFRVDREENKDRISKFLRLALDFNRAYKVIRLENIDDIEIDVGSAIVNAGWKVSKKTAMHLEKHVSEMLKIENSPVASFKFGAGVELPDGIKLINATLQEGVATCSGIDDEKFDFYVVGFERPFRSRANGNVPFKVEETDALFCEEYYRACSEGQEDKTSYIQAFKEKFPSSTLHVYAPDLSDGPTTALFALYAIPKVRHAAFSYEKFADLITAKPADVKESPASDAESKKRKRDDMTSSSSTAQAGPEVKDETVPEIKQDQHAADEFAMPAPKHPKIEELPDEEEVAPAPAPAEATGDLGFDSQMDY